uniref:Uncharacterized protein n=1 Tax=Anopheles farauti TaxID=69004 RepID=A0A182QSL3_9DIPT
MSMLRTNQKQYSTKSAHSSPTHTTNKHTNNAEKHPVEKLHHHYPHHEVEIVADQHGRGGVAGERRQQTSVTTTASTFIFTSTAPTKRKHNHGLYDQVKERSAKKHQPDRSAVVVPATEASTGERNYTPPDLLESVSQLESTISKTIANNEQLKKDEESLLARKAKHKRIDFERIVETELLLPVIERLQDEEFRDDYVIEDVARVPKFYDFSTPEPQPLEGDVDKFVPLAAEQETERKVTQEVVSPKPVASVTRSTLKPTDEKSTTIVKDAPITPITTSNTVPSVTTPKSKPLAREVPTQASLTSTIPMGHVSRSFATTNSPPHPEVTPVVSSVDADEDAPSRSDVTTTISTTGNSVAAPLPTLPLAVSAFDSTKSDAKSTTVTMPPSTATASTGSNSPTSPVVLIGSPRTPAITVPTLIDVSTRTFISTATTTTTTTTAPVTAIFAESTISSAPSASATNTRSANIVTSVPMVKVS